MFRTRNPDPAQAYQVLRKRSEFLSASRSNWVRRPGLILQGRHRNSLEGFSGIRVGFTCSKKVGNAVERNRAKRRLREAARNIIPEHGKAGWDYVLIGRREVSATRPFELLCGDLRRAVSAVHDSAGTK